MICTPLPGGGFVCRSGQRKACATPGCGGRVVALCDYPIKGKKPGATCSAAMCERCRASVGPDRDFCPPHKRAADAQAEALR